MLRLVSVRCPWAATALLALAPSVHVAAYASASPDVPPLDLAALLAEANARNPRIAAAASLKSAAESVPSQMEAPPDPIAGLSYTNVGLTESTLGEEGDSMVELSWTQEIPYSGKLRLAGEAARREIEVTRQRVDQVRLAVAARIKQAYAELYHSDRTAQILGESRALLESFLQSARRRYESGEGLLQNVLKAQTEISKLDAELAVLSQERRTAQARLNTLAGRAADQALGSALELPEMLGPLDAAELESDALARSPDVLEKEAMVLREGARLDLARRQLKPDFIWGAAYSYRGDLDPEISGRFGVRLPLFRDRKQASAVTQASLMLEASRMDASAARLDAARQVRELAAAADRAAALERLYQEGIIPQARSSLESAAASYGVGRVDFLTLLSDFATLLSYEKDLVTQRHERLIALAELERLTARRLVLVGPEPPAAEDRHE